MMEEKCTGKWRNEMFDSKLLVPVGTLYISDQFFVPEYYVTCQREKATIQLFANLYQWLNHMFTLPLILCIHSAMFSENV